MTETGSSIPNVEGLVLDKVGVGEKIPGLDKGSLSLILSVTKMMEKGDQKPDRLVLDEKGQLVLYYGKVEARMGSDQNMDEKMSRLLGIIPQLEGMEGVLHLENVDETSKNSSDTGDDDEDSDSSGDEESGYEDSDDGDLGYEDSGYDDTGDEDSDYSGEESGYEDGSGYEDYGSDDGSGEE